MFQRIHEYCVIQVDGNETILRGMHCSSFTEAMTVENLMVQEAIAEGNDTAATRIYAKVAQDAWIRLSDEAYDQLFDEEMHRYYIRFSSSRGIQECYAALRGASRAGD